jgi:hypothetical protein
LFAAAKSEALELSSVLVVLLVAVVEVANVGTSAEVEVEAK